MISAETPTIVFVPGLRDDVPEHTRPIQGALLAAPPDFESPLPAGYPTQQVLAANGWLPTPRTRLPFPTTVAASLNDPLSSYERVVGLATARGSRLVNVGAVGHLNPAAGYGPWPRAHELIRGFTGTAVCAH